MTVEMPTIAFKHLKFDAAEEIVDSVIGNLYVDTHADVIHDPFYSAERFIERIRGYMRAPGFEVVVGFIDNDPVGLALGYALPEKARWWAGLTTPIEPGFTTEDGTRTFGLCELMVHPGWQGRGVAHAVTMNYCVTGRNGVPRCWSGRTMNLPSGHTQSGDGDESGSFSPTPTRPTTTPSYLI